MLSLIGTRVSIITTTGHHYTGTLEGGDQATNLVLSHCIEWSYVPGCSVVTLDLGCLLLRGDHVAIFGVLSQDEEKKIKSRRISDQARCFPSI